MRRFMPLLYILIGFFVGAFSTRLFTDTTSVEKEKPISEKVVCEKTPDIKASEEKTSEEKNPVAVATAPNGTPAAETPPACPVCPCLFSDKILDPPNYDSRTKEVIESNHEGEALIRWTEVPGAKRYTVHLENEKGQTIKIYKSSRSFLYLKDIPLPEGKQEANYLVRLASVNGKDEEGPLGAKHQLHVKPQANVMAPVIKEIKVED